MRERARVATAEAQYPGNFPNASLHPGREAAMPHPMWQELYNAAVVEFDLAKLPERVEAACQAIHQHRVQKGILSLWRNTRSLTTLYECLFTLMQRSA